MIDARTHSIRLGMGALFAITTLSAVCFALVSLAPGLVGFVVVFALPAAIRVLWAARYVSTPMSGTNLILLFVQSIGGLAIAFVSGIFMTAVGGTLTMMAAALISMAVPAGEATDILALIAIPLGAMLAGLATFIAVLRILWRIWPRPLAEAIRSARPADEQAAE